MSKENFRVQIHANGNTPKNSSIFSLKSQMQMTPELALMNQGKIGWISLETQGL